MPWKEETIMTQKYGFIEEVLKHQRSFSAICEAYNISRQTGYKIMRAFKAGGYDALEAQSRAPHRQARQTPAEIELKVLTIRTKHPTWGGRKIRAYLIRNGLAVASTPHPSTITDILRRHDLIDKEASLKRQKLSRFEHPEPNSLWQMDFKGRFKMLNKSRCFPLTITDDHSRFSLCVQACANEKRETVLSYFLRVCETNGMPKQVNVDNGNPWGNSSLYPHTQFTVTLMKLGIKVTHSRPKHPQTNGKCERLHRTLKEDVILRHHIRNMAHAQSLFDEWRETYNYERPHEALQMAVPADRYQKSPIILPDKVPELEYEAGALLRKVRGNGGFSYNNQEYLIGKAFKNEYVEIKTDEERKVAKVYFGRHMVYRFDLQARSQNGVILPESMID